MIEPDLLSITATQQELKNLTDHQLTNIKNNFQMYKNYFTKDDPNRKYKDTASKEDFIELVTNNWELLNDSNKINFI